MVRVESESTLQGIGIERRGFGSLSGRGLTKQKRKKGQTPKFEKNEGVYLG